HWDIDAASPAGFVDRLWRRRRPLGGGVALLAPEHQLLFGCLHLSRHAFHAGLRWLADLRRLLPVEPEVRARFESEARVWPRRAVYCPLWLLAALGLRDTPPLTSEPASNPVERQLLLPLLVHLLMAEPWLGLPSWRQEIALRAWLFSPDRPSLTVLLARSAGDGMAARLRDAGPRGTKPPVPV
ncbi:MAG TPA: nucleotidyltransferase family protein, partial [Thermoanaerobaculia bacterium]|nr:nucleotidyltransferase family protein [Thermoanaerobaculia bacterium]